MGYVENWKPPTWTVGLNEADRKTVAKLRRAAVYAMKAAGSTYEEIAAEMGICTARARQIDVSITETINRLADARMRVLWRVCHHCGGRGRIPRR